MKQFRAFAMTTFVMLCLISVRSESQPAVKAFIDTPAANNIQYIGMQDELLIFDVRLDNLSGKSTLTIFDENNNEIYSEKIEIKSFAKRYKIAKNNTGKIQFTIKGKQKTISETFTVNYKMEEKLEVAKVK